MAKRLVIMEKILNTMLVPSKSVKKKKPIAETLLSDRTGDMADNAQPTAKQPVRSKIMHDGIDLTPPAFLDRQGKRLTQEEITRLCGTQTTRNWAPIRSTKEIMAEAKKKAPLRIFVANDDAPVTVIAAYKKATKVLGQYANMADFNAGHDFKSYPYSYEESNKDMTVIHCTVAIWAAGTIGVEITEKSPPTKRVLRVQKGNVVADRILALMPEGGGSRKVIQLALEKDGMDKTMLDNSLGGRLDRLVREGKLTKGKVGKGVTYQLAEPTK